MKRVQQLSVKNKIKDFKLCFTTEELKTELDNLDETHSGVFSKNKRAWFQESEKPKIIKLINQQVMKHFEISDDATYVVCVHYPPESEKMTLIKEQNPNIINRVVISSINETPTVSFGNSSEVIELSNWTAYLMPMLTSSMLNLEFSNDKIMKTQPKKGHRIQKKLKKLEDRYIIIIDYILNSEDMTKIADSLMNKLKELNPGMNITNSIEKSIQNLE